MLSVTAFSCTSLLPKLLPLCCQVLWLMADIAPAEDFLCFESEDALTAGTLGFMPRILVVTTLPHRRPESHRFQRVNGRHRLQMRAPRRVGLPYGSYPRLLLAYLTTEAVRSKDRKVYLGESPNDLARKLGLSTISGPRGTAKWLEDQLHRLLSTRLDWKTSVDLAPRSSGSEFVTAVGAAWLEPLQRLLAGRRTWRSQIVLGQGFFKEVTRSAVPVDFRALRQLRRSPLAVDLYIWLTYRMSYLRKPTLIPWRSIQAQFGAGYSRPRDFRRRALGHLEAVVRVYPKVRVGQTDTGLRLFPSPPHVETLIGHRARYRESSARNSTWHI